MFVDDRVALAGRASIVTAATASSASAGSLWSEQTWSVALFGHFNPWITTASWLERYEAITDAEARLAVSNVDVSGAAISVGDLSLEVSLERFLIQSSGDAQRHRLVEIAAQVFSVLGHSPVGSVAMGFDGELLADASGVISHLVAEPLPDVVSTTEARSITFRLAGMSGSGAAAHLTVEDSDEQPGGVYVSLVDEVDLADDDEDGHTAERAVMELTERWPRFTARTREVLNEMIQDLA